MGLLGSGTDSARPPSVALVVPLWRDLATDCNVGSFLYQMTRITSEKGCLRHDDRLDALSIAVGYFTEQMARDEALGIEMHKQEAPEKELERFMDNAFDPLGTRGNTQSTSWISSFTSMG